MGILQNFINKLQEDKSFRIHGQVGGLPADIRRGPGGKYEKQPDLNYPDFNMQPFYSDIYKTEDSVSSTVKSLFGVGYKSIEEVLQRLAFITERFSGLQKSLETQYFNLDDVTALGVSLNNTIHGLNEIKNYFKDGSEGKLNLKVGQTYMPPTKTMLNYLVETQELLKKLYRDIAVIYNQAQGKLDTTQEDVRTLMWECTYALQVIRDGHDAMQRRLQDFQVSVDNLEKPAKPNIPQQNDDLSLEVKPPKEITIPEYKFDSEPPARPEPLSQVAPMPNVIQIPSPSEVVPEEKKVPKKPKQGPIEQTPTSSTPQWKNLLLTEHKEEFENLFNNLPPNLKELINKWTVSENTPDSNTIPISSKEYLQLRRKDNKISEFQILTKDQLNTLLGI